MARFLATGNFRHCKAGEVYDLDPDEWGEQIDAEWLIPYPDDGNDFDTAAFMANRDPDEVIEFAVTDPALGYEAAPFVDGDALDRADTIDGVLAATSIPANDREAARARAAEQAD